MCASVLARPVYAREKKSQKWYSTSVHFAECFLFLSEYQDVDEQEQLTAAIDGSSRYRRIERIPSSQAYQWRAEFVENVVAPRDERVASKLSSALNGKGAFSRFKHALYQSEEWVQAWYAWKQQRLAEALETWLQEER